MSAKPVQAASKSMIKRFLEWEVSAGIVLIISAIAALLVANSSLRFNYVNLQEWALFESFHAIPLHLPETFLLFVNDFLMAFFFLFVGLGIKNEFLQGELSSLKTGTLPFIAATFGMIIPALIFILVNFELKENWRGWAIPAATDIAFAIGAVALLGKRISNALRVLLVAIAVIDDLGAILIIAVFYTSSLHVSALLWAGLGLAVLTCLNLFGVRRLWPYLVIGLFVWFAVHESGIHATVAGVLVALSIPCRVEKGQVSPLIKLETRLAHPVNFLVLPLFGFLNAGVTLLGLGVSSLVTRLPLGITLGLFFGKQIGIFGSVFACIKLGLAKAPKNSTYAQIYGISILCGIGFTMSLFIGGLSFDSVQHAAGVRIGVLVGSILSLVFGYVFLRLVSKRPT